MRGRLLLAAAAALAAAVAVVPVLADDDPAEPDRPVSAAEARAAVQRVVDLTARGRFADVCRAEPVGCAMSQTAAASRYAPGPDRPPAVRCTFALPEHLRGTAWGDGHVVVLAGRDAQDRPYVSQQLVLRVDDRLEVHEPAFWFGLAYNGFGGRRGAAWSAAYGDGPTEPSFTAKQTARAERSCTDTAGYLATVAPDRAVEG